LNRPPPQPRRENILQEERSAYDGVVQRFRQWFGQPGCPDEHFEVGTYFGAMLNSPLMCAMASEMGVFFRGVGNRLGAFSHADREFVDQVLSALWSTTVVQNIHIVDAVKAGVRIEAIDALRQGRDDLLNEDETLLATYIRQVVNGTVDPTIYARMEDRQGIRGLVEYTGFICWLQWIMRMMQALDTGAISDEEVDTLIEKARQVSAEATS
jgi:hypothetical protein